jgi:hypothetical protein
MPLRDVKDKNSVSEPESVVFVTYMFLVDMY